MATQGGAAARVFLSVTRRPADNRERCPANKRARCLFHFLLLYGPLELLPRQLKVLEDFLKRRELRGRKGRLAVVLQGGARGAG
jgi:hypothetical protein